MQPATDRSPGAGSRGTHQPWSAAAALRQLFDRRGIIRTVGAHDALGARLGERAGFDAIWASGFEVSASHGLPDADILTMSELLTAAQWIASSVRLPVVADCDAGYGNATNVAHMVRRYEAAGIAGICIEDKAFPKVNSFVPGRQRLVSIAEFVGKLSAARAAQQDPNLMIIGRVEALVAGLGIDEALRRADAYAEAGAHAILIHSKCATPKPVLDFLAAWTRPTPIVVVPTTYFQISASELERAGARMVIYANHGLRASVQAIMEAFHEIRRCDGTAAVEDRIAPLSTIFDLQGVSAQLAHDATYVHGDERRVLAVIPTGRELPDTPVTGLGISGQSLLQRQVEALHGGGVDTIAVVTDVEHAAPVVDEAVVVVDENWAEHGEVGALLSACDDEHDTVLFAAHDTLFEARLVRQILAEQHDVVVAVTSRQPAEARSNRVPSGSNRGVGDIGSIGLVKLTRHGVGLIRDDLDRTARAGAGSVRDVDSLLARLERSGHHIHYFDCPSGFIMIKSEQELESARSLAPR